jgi:hypothetical protein
VSLFENVDTEEFLRTAFGEPRPQDLAELRRFEEKFPLQPKQQTAEDLAERVDALLYGGAAGGGKSHWMLVHMGRQMLRFPGNKGVITVGSIDSTSAWHLAP